MIIVCDLSGKPLCYLITSEQRKRFIDSVPPGALFRDFTYIYHRAFGTAAQ